MQSSRCVATVRTLSSGVASGVNVVLAGPPGTGKDHLLTALMWQACKFGFSVEWVNGLDLFAEYRDAIDGSTTESALLAGYVRARCADDQRPDSALGDSNTGTSGVSVPHH